MNYLRQNRKFIASCLCLICIISLSSCATKKVPGSSTTTTSAATTSAATTDNSPKYEITYTSAVTYADSVGTVWAQVIAEITNTGNIPLYLNNASYDLEDSTGKLISSQSYVSCYPELILPGEKGYMYEEDMLDNATAGMSLKVLPRVDIEAAKVECLRMQTSEITLSDDEFLGLKVMGRVENTTSAVQDDSYIAIVLYDASDKPTGLAFTIITESIPVGGNAESSENRLFSELFYLNRNPALLSVRLRKVLNFCSPQSLRNRKLLNRCT